MAEKYLFTDVFFTEVKEEYKKQIASFEWRAAKFLAGLLDFICSRAAQENAQKVYIATDHIGLYEKMGFEYLGIYTDRLEGCEDRVYFRKL